MATESSTPSELNKQRAVRVVLACACALITGGCGYFLGAATAHREVWGERLETAVGRIGYRMSTDEMGPLENFPALGDDLAAAESALDEPEGGMLRLIFALREPQPERETSLQDAAAVCRELGWPRCDDPALRRMQERLSQ